MQTRQTDQIGLDRAAGQSFDSSRRRHRKHATVIGANDLPAAIVDHPVMPVAKKCEIRKVARPVIDPVHQMMALSHAHRPIASWPRASTVPNLERLALWS